MIYPNASPTEGSSGKELDPEVEGEAGALDNNAEINQDQSGNQVASGIQQDVCEFQHIENEANSDHQTATEAAAVH
ncbi:Hypothetical predicted protein [Olea europaea subsp. europaea]|uniref:Uncharacterized protein n=1 Tax=Olea europaea subsp. europaea TaxID=158383 RepID=A0A8S0Q9M6_OLEEU|nr:Hypothetical predicted protein [Olea europaea subsp. europaea]